MHVTATTHCEPVNCILNFKRPHVLSLACITTLASGALGAARMHFRHIFEGATPVVRSVTIHVSRKNLHEHHLFFQSYDRSPRLVRATHDAPSLSKKPTDRLGQLGRARLGVRTDPSRAFGQLACKTSSIELAISSCYFSRNSKGFFSIVPPGSPRQN